MWEYSAAVKRLIKFKRIVGLFASPNSDMICLNIRDEKGKRKEREWKNGKGSKKSKKGGSSEKFVDEIIWQRNQLPFPAGNILDTLMKMILGDFSDRRLAFHPRYVPGLRTDSDADWVTELLCLGKVTTVLLIGVKAWQVF